LANVSRLSEVRTITDTILLGLRSKLIAAIKDDAEKAYLHGYAEGLKEENVSLNKSINKDKYSHINFKPTEAMSKNAAKGLEYRKEFGRGGTAVGVARARDIKNRKNLSPRTCKRMKSYFSRHEVDKKGKNWGNSSNPSNGYIAWLLWGGDAGFSWAKARVRQIDAADKKKELVKSVAFEDVVDWNLADQQAMDQVVDHGLILSDDYYNDVNRKIQTVIAESFADQRSIPSVVRSLREVVQTETYKLTRIARTEIINATNEGRLSSFKKLEANKKLLFEQGKITKKPKEHKYTLIVALGARTCDAHRDLAREIPRGGLTLSELITLQQEIGSRHGLTLSGNSLLHPNQRTVISRVVQ
jgi:hypothetical protein